MLTAGRVTTGGSGMMGTEHTVCTTSGGEVGVDVSGPFELGSCDVFDGCGINPMRLRNLVRICDDTSMVVLVIDMTADSRGYRWRCTRRLRSRGGEGVIATATFVGAFRV